LGTRSCRQGIRRKSFGDARAQQSDEGFHFLLDLGSASRMRAAAPSTVARYFEDVEQALRVHSRSRSGSAPKRAAKVLGSSLAFAARFVPMTSFSPLLPLEFF